MIPSILDRFASHKDGMLQQFYITYGGSTGRVRYDETIEAFSRDDTKRVTRSLLQLYQDTSLDKMTDAMKAIVYVQPVTLVSEAVIEGDDPRDDDIAEDEELDQMLDSIHVVEDEDGKSV